MKELKKIIDNDFYYNGVCLKDLAENYGTPLKVTFLDVIKDRVLTLKNAFNDAIKETNYNNKFIYLNANKANYGVLEILEAFKYSDGLETSSYYDLLLTYEMFRRNPKYKDKYIVCNGYKQHDYIDTIIAVAKEGYNIIDIIDSRDEYLYLKSKGINLNVGLRIHLAAQYVEKDDEPKNDRFGLTDDDYKFIIDDIKNSNLVLKVIHFHQRGMDYEKEKFEINFKKVFEKYYVYAKKQYNTLEYYDIGGGTPLPLYGNYDYKEWAKYVLSLLKQMCKDNNISEPSLISENGKYSQKDSTVNIYKVVGKKYTDEYPWYIVDSSMVIAMLESFLGEEFDIRPLNNLDCETEKARLGGITCDCDDIYQKEEGYIELPKTENLYIGILGTGSYQNSMNGKGGVHHCLLPEEKDVVLYTENGELKSIVRSELQSIKDIFKIMKY